MGLLGCGGFAPTLIEPFERIENAEITAVYNRTFSKAEALGKELGVPVFSSYVELLEQKNIDGVLINTSHDQHKPMALAAAARGKHIFCEKPMALNVAECQAMIKAAEESNVKLYVGHVARFLPLFKRIKEIIDSGLIGKPLAVSMTNYLPRIRSGWWAKRDLKGGLLHSPASHEVDYMNYLLGIAASVFAMGAPQVQKQLDYEDSMFVTIRYESGAIGSISASLSSRFPVQLGFIVAEKGGLQYDMYGPEGGQIEYQVEGHTKQKELIGGFGISVGVRSEIQDFVDWVLYDTEPLMTADGGMRAIEVIEAAYQSIKMGESIPIPISR
jgi:myo-inositol 2-dehydrogenase/D-chiro-inositol 1-dehydrogenase/scyllo-inositol 2-dehydrogenase (NAD+)